MPVNTQIVYHASQYTNCICCHSIHKLYASTVNRKIVQHGSQYTNCMSHQEIHKLYVLPGNTQIICLASKYTNCTFCQLIHKLHASRVNTQTGCFYNKYTNCTPCKSIRKFSNMSNQQIQKLHVLPVNIQIVQMVSINFELTNTGAQKTLGTCNAGIIGKYGC